ncbi:MAG TPA: amidohydrolase [Sphingomonadaceae bacterium]|nr:amidohydrolase [Sphingomonadaceae bacterium]
MADLVEFRHELHRYPEISGQERETAQRVAAFLQPMQPDELITGLGGHGIAAVFQGAEPGPTVLFRCELDALPIEELSDLPYKSTISGRGHLCGHDGHMATLAGLALGLARQRPASGRGILLFQPAEETGAGAAAVIADPKFASLRPDVSFALHNAPGQPLGTVGLVEGPVNCASRGIRIALGGKTAHASLPQSGLSPMPAIAQLMPALSRLGGGDITDTDFAMVTVTHCRMGEPTFGVAPGYAEVWATLRTLTDARMTWLCAEAEKLAHTTAEPFGLTVGIAYDDIFLQCENAPEAVAHLRDALDAEGIPHGRGNLPMRGSEDFGRFGAHAPAAMFFLGSGENHPRLHNPDYDFPDALIGIGARVFMRVARNILG